MDKKIKNNQENAVLFKKLTPDTKSPSRNTSTDAGWDLYSTSETVEIPGRCSYLISTGISLAIPAGYYGRVAPRSGLSVKGLDVGAGVIDSGYRGEVKVLLRNTTPESMFIEKGQKIAQIIFTAISTSEMIEVQDLLHSERGDKGFGSSGDT